MKGSDKCTFCIHYMYCEESCCYVCDVDLDMDEMEQFTLGNVSDCPYYGNNDEYAIVRKQN